MREILDPFVAESDIYTMRNRIADSFYILFTLISFIVVPISLSRYFYQGWLNIMTLHVVVSLIMWTLTYYRRQLPMGLKAGIVCFLTFISSLHTLHYGYGMIGGIGILVVSCLLIALFYGEIYAAAASVFFGIVMIVFGYCVVNGFIELDEAHLQFRYLMSSWLVMAFIQIFFISMVVYIPGRLFNMLASSNNRLREIMTEIHDKNEMLNQAAEREREQFETITEQAIERKQLLHILCHDLSNPISAISTISKLLEEDSGDKGELLELLSMATGNCSGLINQIRSFMASELKVSESSLTEEALASLIQKSKSILKYKLSQKNIDLKVNVDPSITVLVAPVIFVNTVVNNLLSNAIKFSDTNSSIECSAEQNDQNTVLTIKDYGIGMPPEILGSLFQLDQPCSRTGTSGETGTGFGMPLVKKYVEAFNGRIEIFSQEKSDTIQGSGTIVTITLPIC